MLVVASCLVPSVISPEAERVGMQLASPALAVKGRLRGPSVLDQRKTLKETMVALETAAAAKRYRKPHRKPISTSRTAALVLANPSLPNGVGIQGRGRSAMNGPIGMSSGSDCVAALQQRGCNSLMAAADYRPMKKVLPLAPAGAGKFAEMPDRDDFSEGVCQRLRRLYAG